MVETINSHVPLGVMEIPLEKPMINAMAHVPLVTIALQDPLHPQRNYVKQVIMVAVSGIQMQHAMVHVPQVTIAQQARRRQSQRIAPREHTEPGPVRIPTVRVNAYKDIIAQQARPLRKVALLPPLLL